MDPERTEKTGRDPAPGLLDEKQWSYLQRHYELTPRERQIAELVCRGFGNSHIAESLRIQVATVKVHVRSIYRKVKVKSRISMLLRFVNEAGAISSDPAYTPSIRCLDQ